MFRSRLLTVAALVGTLGLLAPFLGSAAPARTAELPTPLVAVSALQLADSVRYGVTLVRHDQRHALPDVQVEVTLTADASLVEALETPGYTRFAGQQDNVLTWTATVGASDYADALSFRLRQPASAPPTVLAHWGGSAPGTVATTVDPYVHLANTLSGEVSLAPRGRPPCWPPATAGSAWVSRRMRSPNPRACKSSGWAPTPTRPPALATCGGARWSS